MLDSNSSAISTNKGCRATITLYVCSGSARCAVMIKAHQRDKQREQTDGDEGNKQPKSQRSVMVDILRRTSTFSQTWWLSEARLKTTKANIIAPNERPSYTAATLIYCALKVKEQRRSKYHKKQRTATAPFVTEHFASWVEYTSHGVMAWTECCDQIKLTRRKIYWHLTAHLTDGWNWEIDRESKWHLVALLSTARKIALNWHSRRETSDNCYNGDPLHVLHFRMGILAELCSRTRFKVETSHIRLFCSCSHFTSDTDNALRVMRKDPRSELSKAFPLLKQLLPSKMTRNMRFWFLFTLLN